MFRASRLRQLSHSRRDALFASVHTICSGALCSVAYILAFRYGITLALRGGFSQVDLLPGMYRHTYI